MRQRTVGGYVAVYMYFYLSLCLRIVVVIRIRSNRLISFLHFSPCYTLYELISRAIQALKLRQACPSSPSHFSSTPLAHILETF